MGEAWGEEERTAMGGQGLSEQGYLYSSLSHTAVGLGEQVFRARRTAASRRGNGGHKFLEANTALIRELRVDEADDMLVISWESR